MTATAIPAKKVKAKKNSQFMEVMRRLFKNKTATIGLIIICTVFDLPMPPAF